MKSLAKTILTVKLKTTEAELKSSKLQKKLKISLIKKLTDLKDFPQTVQKEVFPRGYIDTLLELPWNKSSKDNLDIKEAKQILEDDHYGLSDVKKRVLEFLAVRALTKAGDAPIICLVGPPGTGKTSIARSIARALNKKYVRICLGGVRDEAEIADTERLM